MRSGRCWCFSPSAGCFRPARQARSRCLPSRSVARSSSASSITRPGSMRSAPPGSGIWSWATPSRGPTSRRTWSESPAALLEKPAGYSIAPALTREATMVTERGDRRQGGKTAMKRLLALLFGLALAPLFLAPVHGSGDEDEYRVLLERLRKESPGEHGKVVELAKKDPAAALQFLRARFGKKGEKSGDDK